MAATPPQSECKPMKTRVRNMLDVAENIVRLNEANCLDFKIWNPFCSRRPYRLTLTVEVKVLLLSNMIASFFFLVLHVYISFSLFCLCRVLFATYIVSVRTGIGLEALKKGVTQIIVLRLLTPYGFVGSNDFRLILES
jgi:hypothetical protein